MPRKSKGARQGSRFKMQAKKKGKIITPNKLLRKFEVGEKVHINIHPNIKDKGYPYISFQGLTGTIIERRGSAYIIKFRDKNAEKTAILKAIHLQRQKF